MARHGENIRKRKDGRWEGRYGVYSEKKGRKVYLSVYGRSYEEAKEKLTTMKNLSKITAASPNLQRSRASAPAEIRAVSVGEAADMWLGKVRRENKPSTYVKYRQIYQNHIQEPLRDEQASALTSESVRAKIFRREGKDALSDSTVKSIYCVLNQILKYASENWAVPVPRLKKPALSSRSKPVRTLSRKEQTRLFSVLYHDMDASKLGVLMCLYTGLRLGELCALKWSDIDFKNRLLTVNRTVQRLYAEGHKTKTILVETPPKSLYSRREIPLPEEIFALLLRFQKDAGGEYIFGKDGPMEPRTMQNHFKSLLKEAELPDRNFHILRHTFATNCIEEGMDVKALSEMLGHSDVRITLNRYVHPSTAVKRRYMDNLNAYYGKISNQARDPICDSIRDPIYGQIHGQAG